MATQEDKPDVIYRSLRSLKVGQLERYVISYEPNDQEEALLGTPHSQSLWLRVRNVESIALRAAVLRGPFIIYCDVRPAEYDHHTASFVSAEQPHFEPNLSPGQSFIVELPMHTIKSQYVWIVDVMSQILFSSATDVCFELLISRTKEGLNIKNFDKLGSFDQMLTVNRKDTMDLWNLPQQQHIKNTEEGKQKKDVHLVILSHGLHSNTGTDLFYIKEQLDKMALTTGEDLIVRGFHGNACKTEKGVKYLGSKLAEYIVDELYNDSITQVSFIGHSLGGLIQTFAIAYLEINFPWFFQRVQPVNFITLASPLLGIVTDNPAYVKAALSFGIVGRTGQDLGLEAVRGEEEPLLKVLPTGPTHKILKRFVNRTVYANSVNDGIVPLYTSALLYLDWKGLNTVSKAQKKQKQNSTVSIDEQQQHDDNSTTTTGKIPNTVDEDLLTKATNTFINPFQKAMSILAPNVQSEKTNGVVDDETSSQQQKSSFPKTSMIESAAALLLPPLPPAKFINDPDSREDVIIHDRIYTEDDIPPRPLQRKKTFIQSLDPMAKFEEMEEEIAREWHKGMSWRKVLVKLQPDAHNNIIVRRRFANAFGWQVVDHLVEAHFSKVISSNEEEEEGGDHEGGQTPDDLDNMDELSSLMDRENVRKDNEELDLGELIIQEGRNDNKLTHWVNKQQQESLFDIGPTGILNNINEMFDTWKNWGLNSALGQDPGDGEDINRELCTEDLADGFI